MSSTGIHKQLSTIWHVLLRTGLKFIVLVQFLLIAQQLHAAEEEESSYDEIIITLNVQRIGNAEVSAVIQGDKALLSIRNVFDFLKIKNSPSHELDSIAGFIVNPQASFLIDFIGNKIIYRGKEIQLKKGDLLKTDGDLFLRTEVFGEVFGLDCRFEFRSLTVIMKSRIDLPAILELQQHQMRQNISHLKGERKADTTIKRKFPMFALGTADWSYHSIKQIKGISNTGLSLNLGAMVAGGEATANLTYNTIAPFNKDHQFYNWRYVNNNKKFIKQVSLGNVFSPAITTLEAGLTGIQFTNTPTSFKKSFGTYTLSNRTDADWTVELYINNIMVNYTKADASGFFSFEVPVLYGSNVIKLRHVSPWGEERIVEEFVNIPYNLVPANHFEYTVTAGLVKNEMRSQFSRVNFNYGLNNRITIGGGVEYFSSLLQKKMPFATASVRIGSNMVFSGEHAVRTRSKGVLTYKLPSNIQLDMSYVKYDPLQTAIRTNFIEEKRAVLSLPFRTKKFSSFYRFTYNEGRMPKDKITNAEFLVSAVLAGVTTNITSVAVMSPSKKAIFSSNMSLGLKLPKNFRLSPQVQYDYAKQNVNMLKAELEKNLFTHGFLNISYENYFLSKNQVFSVGFRYNFSGAQTFLSVRNDSKATVITQSARGSILYAGGKSPLIYQTQNATGRGGLKIRAFLDFNNNGKRDKSEPLAPGLKFNIRGGIVKHNEKDTTSTVAGLEAYADYIVELNKHCFENIAWQVRHASIKVTIEPNHFKQIEVPVSVLGEVSGTVYLEDKTASKGLGRMIVTIYDQYLNVVATTLSEPDGYFNYLGLVPGKYTLGINKAQLINTKLSLPESPSFEVKLLTEGDVVNKLKLVLRQLP